MAVSIIQAGFRTDIAQYAGKHKLSRNLLRYPITKEEVKQVLEDIYMREIDDDRVGDQRAYIFSKAIEIALREFHHDDYNP